jgi:hypothetical protein
MAPGVRTLNHLTWPEVLHSLHSSLGGDPVGAALCLSRPCTQGPLVPVLNYPKVQINAKNFQIRCCLRCVCLTMCWVGM